VDCQPSLGRALFPDCPLATAASFRAAAHERGRRLPRSTITMRAVRYGGQMIRSLLVPLAAGALATAAFAQAPPVVAIPDGLPTWAFNLPDPVQPRSFRPEGIV